MSSTATRKNRFFTEDFEQRRLAYHAAPTALAVNMQLYWAGVAADLWRAGDKSLEWLLKGAGAGEVFANGHAETGNDLPLLYSTTRAERVDGGYRFTGRKSFGSLTPVWTYLGTHGMDTSDPQTPKIVHAFIPCSTMNYSVQEIWDTLGMRATRFEVQRCGALEPRQGRYGGFLR